MDKDLQNYIFDLLSKESELALCEMNREIEIDGNHFDEKASKYRKSKKMFNLFNDFMYKFNEN